MFQLGPRKLRAEGSGEIWLRRDRDVLPPWALEVAQSDVEDFDPHCTFSALSSQFGVWKITTYYKQDHQLLQ
jgi:hypothetical protein